MTKRGTLVIAGVGPAGPAQLTLEAIEALKSCRRVLCLVKLDPPFEAFASGAGIAAETVAWTGKSAAGVTTEKLLERLESELSRGGRIGVVVDGHPEVFSPAAELAARCSKAGHAVRSVPAVGSLELLLAAAERRLPGALSRGFSAINALSADWKAFAADPGLCLFVYNLGALAREGALAPAAGALARACAGRKLLLVECLPSGEENALETSAKGLAGDLKKIGVNATLVADPVR